jgi:hypothetical protein
MGYTYGTGRAVDSDNSGNFTFFLILEIRLQTLSLIEKLYKMTMKRQVIKESLQIGIQ